MVQLLEGRGIAPIHFAFLDVCAVAQYLILEEDYLTPYLVHYMADEETCKSPSTFKGIERLYVAEYSNLAKHLYILTCSRSPPQTLQTACAMFPGLFQDTDFFWGDDRLTLHLFLFNRGVIVRFSSFAFTLLAYILDPRGQSILACSVYAAVQAQNSNTKL